MINLESVDAIREAVRELELTGYIARTRERNNKGHLQGSDYTIFERPQIGVENTDVERPVDIKTASDKPTRDKSTWDKPTLENPTLENPTLENPTLDYPAQDKPVLDSPTLENPTQLSTIRTNTKLPNTNQEKTNQSNPHPSISLSSSILYAEEEGWDGKG